MKKPLIFILLLSLALVGCSTKQGNIEDKKVQVSNTKENKENNKNVDININEEKFAIKEKNNELDEYNLDREREKNISYVKFNDTYISDNLELKISSYRWVDKIEPVVKNSFYTYYKLDNPSQAKFIKMVANGTNKFTEAISFDGLNFTLLINDKYKYNLQVAEESNGTLSSLVYVNPLEKKRFYIFGEIPNEAINDIEKITLKVGYNDGYNNMFDSLESKDNIIEFEMRENKL